MEALRSRARIARAKATPSLQLTVIDTVATADDTLPSEALNVNESLPENPAFGV